MRRKVLHLVIGAGQPPNLDFVVGVAKALPDDARIYAVFSGGKAFERLGEHDLGAMTREEFRAFCALAWEACGREHSRPRAGAAVSAEYSLNNLRGRAELPPSETLSEKFSGFLSTSEPPAL